MDRLWIDGWMLQRHRSHPYLLGHVDAGKSTLMGHLLFLLGCVSKKAMHKLVITNDDIIATPFN